MSWSIILAKLKTDLESVTNIGQVHNSVRWTIFAEDFWDRFSEIINNQREIRTWLISRENTASAYGPLPSGALGTQVSIGTRQAIRRHDIVIDGFMSFKDNDTESDFQALVDSVLDVLEPRTSFDDAIFVRSTEINCIIDMIEFSDWLCHHVNITFYVVERNNITPT